MQTNLFAELFCLGKKFLVFNLVTRNLKVKYRRSVLGVFWTLMVPLSTAAVFYFVFKYVLLAHTQNYVSFVLAGILSWGFFSQSMTEGSDSILGNAALSSKIPVPAQVFPFVANITNWITLLLGLPVLLGISFITGAHLNFSLLALIPLFGCLFLTAYAASLTFGISLVYLRDLRHALGVIMQIWFYATPVLYPVEKIPEKFRFLVYLNPVGSVFAGIHEVIPFGRWPEPKIFLISFGWSALLLLIAGIVLKLFGKDLAERF